MVSAKTLDIAERSKSIYENRLRSDFEKYQLHQFVAIEPDSGDYFLGETLSQAIQAARKVHPNRISFTLRVGHQATVNLGVCAT